MAGRFIVFEGIDGSGKSSTLATVAKELGIWATREETDSYLGDAVRKSIEEGADPMATAYLFLADRARHIPEIKQRLADGHVLCDRYMHSTLAYQSATLADRMRDPIAFLRFLHVPLGLEPHKVLLFDVDPAISLARIGDRTEQAAYEKVAFLEKVRGHYKTMAASRPDLFHVIDASKPQDDVVAEALRVVKETIG